MRTLTDHIVEGDSVNHQLTINVLDEHGQGGACHAYQIVWYAEQEDKSYLAVPITFQKGPIKEFGVNGVTHESLLAIVIDRLRCFQNGPYGCADNAEALEGCAKALHALQCRTVARIARGVEGTDQL